MSPTSWDLLIGGTTVERGLRSRTDAVTAAFNPFYAVPLEDCRLLQKQDQEVAGWSAIRRDVVEILPVYEP